MIALVTALCLLTPPPAAAPNLDDVLASLRKHRSVSATLVQKKHSKVFKRPQEARGRLLVVPPDKVRWEYTSPFRAVLVVNGRKASMAYPDLDRKQTFDLDREPEMRAVLSTTLFFLRTSPDEMRRQYQVTVSRKGPAEVQLGLVPRSEKARAMVAEVQVGVNVARGVLSGLRLVEPDGDVTHLEFSGVVIDGPIDEGLLQP